MAIALGVFDPKYTDEQASALALKLNPEFAVALESEIKRFAETTELRHYIINKTSEQGQ